MQTPVFLEQWARAAKRVMLSYYVANGLTTALGVLLISGGVHHLFGAFAGASASVGAVVVTPPDRPAPRRGKFWQLLPAALLGLPLFFGIQVLYAESIDIGLLLIPATFVAFLGAAWGKRGLPISIAVMLAMIFSIALPEHADMATGFSASLYFSLGAALYLVFATIANSMLNGRYRVQMVADTLLDLAKLMRTQACQFTSSGGSEDNAPVPLIGQLMYQQAALADQLQTVRDILLESPTTLERQRLAGMLMQLFDMRDYLLACELDLDTLKAHSGHAPALRELREILESLADIIEKLADSLLLGRRVETFESYRPRLAGMQWLDNDAASFDDDAVPDMLARGLANRVGQINDETLRMIGMSRDEVEVDPTLLQSTWRTFVSPTTWSWQPFAELWHFDAPPLRHAIRAALAIMTGYLISRLLPWGSHPYWILLTIIVVLRGNLAQTVERRNKRLAGTLIGCLLAGSILSVHPSPLVLLLVVTLSQAVAHAFAIKRYLITAVAATLLGLAQAYALNMDTNPGFEVLERLVDTLLGGVIAWTFSYVLPSWERNRIPYLVARTLAAQVRHAHASLGLGLLTTVDTKTELVWRLARRDAYESLSALVQATQQSLSEPRAVRPPLEPLGRLLAHSYQLLAQLTAVKTTLLLHRERLQVDEIGLPLRQAAENIDATLNASFMATCQRPLKPEAALNAVSLPDPFENNLNPWVMRRLDLASGIAVQIHDDADQVLRILKTDDVSKQIS